MLKIKDNIPLRELKKFGFEYCRFDRVYIFGVAASVLEVESDRNINLLGDLDEKEGDKYLDVIYNLIKADMVERVENGNGN